MEKYPKKRAYAHPKLAKFLKEKGVYKQFVNNCKEQNNERFNTDISRAFIWDKTKEGDVFWSELDIDFEGLNEQI